MLKDFQELLMQARKVGPRRLVVACAGDKHILSAVITAQKENIADYILVSEERPLVEAAARLGMKLDSSRVIAVGSPEESCRLAVQMVSRGEADLLVKGKVDTTLLLREVLNQEYGLRQEGRLSHLVMVEAGRLGRVVFVTDGGMNIKPDLEEKAIIIQNAIDAARALGWQNPKVAVLAATEKVNMDIPVTIEAAALAQMARRGQIKGGQVDGPLALDNALSQTAATAKGISGPVAGQADILVVPELIAGNILGKAPIYFAGDRIAAVLCGTKRPVVVTSRANTAAIRLVSIAAGVLMCQAK